MNKWMARAATVVAGAAAFTLMSAASASAHECFNASRSERGSAAAGTNSQAWFQMNFADAVAEEVEDGLYSDAEGECVYAEWIAGGGPESLTFHVKGANGQDGVLAAGNPTAGRSSDGKGIDHFGESYGELLGTSYDACLEAPPED